MRFVFHGAGCEVGRSCIEIDDKSSDTRILLDAGIKVHEHGIEHPTQIEDIRSIQGVFISHAHLDHTGSLPLFDHMGMKCPIFCTHITKGITKILLDDSLHVQLLKQKHAAYSEFDIDDAVKRMKLVNYRQPGRYRNMGYEFFDAGHIPGSSSILLEMGGKRILYTGDLNTRRTRLLDGADTSYKDIDVMITESTYGDEDHPSRSSEEKLFFKEVRKILSQHNPVLVPVFSLGRAQEISLLLSEQDPGVPLYLDGMARKITSVCLSSPKLGSSSRLREAMKKIKVVKNRDYRESIFYKKAVFMTTSGMLNGGPVLDYLKHLWHNPGAGILMTGYQAEGTNGRMLLESERAFVDGMQIHFDGTIKKFDFSAHSGKSELINLVRKVNPKKVIINHGDSSSALELKRSLSSLVPDIYCPETGESLDI